MVESIDTVFSNNDISLKCMTQHSDKSVCILKSLSLYYISDFVCGFQVPRSSNKLHEDNEYALYTVVLFRKVSDTFKTAARENGFQVYFCSFHEICVYGMCFCTFADNY